MTDFMHSIITFHILAEIFVIGTMAMLIYESVHAPKEKEVLQCDEKKCLKD